MNEIVQSQDTSSQDYERIASAIHYLTRHYNEQPNLDELAAHLNLSPYYLQRLFRRWAGISPKRFVQYLTIEHAKALLSDSYSVLDAAHASGLSGPGRLHDLFVAVEAVTPGEYKQQGAGIPIDYGFHATPFGECLIAVTERGVCALLFVEEDRATAMAQLRAQWARAELEEAPTRTQPSIDLIFPAQTDDAAEGGNQRSVTLLLRGTNFQVKVWEALLRIPSGALATYGHIAQVIGKPTAARAVGQAVGANAIAYLIPCHRVIRASGEIRDYRWGKTRKQAMLGWEAAHRDHQQAHEEEITA